MMPALRYNLLTRVDTRKIPWTKFDKRELNPTLIPDESGSYTEQLICDTWKNGELAVLATQRKFWFSPCQIKICIGKPNVNNRQLK